MFKASCLCGQVSLQALAIETPYVYCHCPSCRKSSGSAFAANVSVPIDSFEIVSGHDCISTIESSPLKVRHFCKQCGSPLFTKVGAQPAYVRIRLGALDTEFSEAPSAHIFTDQKAPWHEIKDDHPQYAAWPDASAVPIPGSRQKGG